MTDDPYRNFPFIHVSIFFNQQEVWSVVVDNPLPFFVHSLHELFVSQNIFSVWRYYMVNSLLFQVKGDVAKC